MNDFRKPDFRILMLCIVLVSLVGFQCSQQVPFSPSSSDPTDGLTLPSLSNNEESDFIKRISDELEGHSIKKLISASTGGTVQLFGISVHIPPGALSTDRTITIEIQKTGYEIYDFMPNDITFLKPIEVTLCYNDADLTDIKEENITVYGWSYTEKKWEYIGGVVYPSPNKIVIPVVSLTRYALKRAGT